MQDEPEEELAFCGKCEKRGVAFMALFYSDPEGPFELAHQHFAVCIECGDERDMPCSEDGDGE